ncbi:MAG: squalene synthase HpnC [Burkholderiales bacterium]|nr:squalene synthase HpnC [Burkholderiales bacterium]OJX05960.1 MAG: squalene synthase HpnC [Burkholderiales bacterium 70-64]
MQSLVTSVDHYENFPVGSLLIPARLRPALVAIYRFARYADDLADEGEAASAERLAALEALDRALRGEGLDPPIVAQLRPHLAAHALPVAPLRALLSAFAQDCGTVRHASWNSVLDYCRRSANPVGELVLRLFGAWNAATRERSDAICTALQVLNFLQDLAVDWRRGRLYLPLDELRAAGLGERDVARAVEAGRLVDPQLAWFLDTQTARARAMLQAGAQLVGQLPWRLSLELRAIVAGGLRIAERLAAAGSDPVAARPSLGWRDAPALMRLWWRTPA